MYVDQKIRKEKKKKKKKLSYLLLSVSLCEWIFLDEDAKLLTTWTPSLPVWGRMITWKKQIYKHTIKDTFCVSVATM